MVEAGAHHTMKRVEGGCRVVGLGNALEHTAGKKQQHGQ